MKRLLLALLLLPALALAELPLSRTRVVDVEVTVDAANDYADGDNVGGLLSVPLPLNGGRSGRIKNIAISNRAVDGEYLVWIFSANPSASTFTDNAVIAIADADIEKAIPCGVIGVDTNWVSPDNNLPAVAVSALSLPCGFMLASGETTLYVAIHALGAMNQANAADMHMRIEFEMDQ